MVLCSAPAQNEVAKQTAAAGGWRAARKPQPTTHKISNGLAEARQRTTNLTNKQLLRAARHKQQRAHRHVQRLPHPFLSLSGWTINDAAAPHGRLTAVTGQSPVPQLLDASKARSSALRQPTAACSTRPQRTCVLTADSTAPAAGRTQHPC